MSNETVVFFDEQSRIMHEAGIARIGTPVFIDQRYVSLDLISEVAPELNQHEQQAAEDLAMSTVMIACSQHKLAGRATVGNQALRNELALSGYQTKLHELYEGQREAAAGREIDTIFQAAWLICQEVTQATLRTDI